MLLLKTQVDKHLVKAIIKFWDSSFQCFLFNQHDMTPTIKKILALPDFGPLEIRLPLYKAEGEY